MMKIVIATQYHENYGAHDWDGKGQCPQYWKPKGGSEYVISRKLTFNESLDTKLVDALVAEATKHLNRSTDYSREYVIDWYFIQDGELTAEEKQWMEWEGKVTYPSKVIDVEIPDVA
jgi:hypothetical protein